MNITRRDSQLRYTSTLDLICIKYNRIIQKGFSYFAESIFGREI